MVGAGNAANFLGLLRSWTLEANSTLLDQKHFQLNSKSTRTDESNSHPSLLLIDDYRIPLNGQNAEIT